MALEPAKSFQDLVVCQKAHAFVLAIYRFSANFPVHETYGLRAQLRRAAVSVPANISEGFKKRGKAEKARMLNIAEASLEESRYYLLPHTTSAMAANPRLVIKRRRLPNCWRLTPVASGLLLRDRDSVF